MAHEAFALPIMIVGVSVVFFLSLCIVIFFRARNMMRMGGMESRRKRLQSLREAAVGLRNYLDANEKRFSERLGHWPDTSGDSDESLGEEITTYKQALKHENEVLLAKRQIAFNTFATNVKPR